MNYEYRVMRALEEQLLDLELRKAELEGQVRMVEAKMKDIKYQLDLLEFKKNKDKVNELIAKNLI